MKRMVMLLLAAMLVFSFAGCTQYDFSALEDFWQEQFEESQNRKDAQKIADRSDLSSLIKDAFKNADITYYEENPFGASSSRTVMKILYAVADYDGYHSGDAIVDGKLLFILQTSEDNGKYTIESYTVEIPADEPLKLTIDGKVHELSITVSADTKAYGTITKNGDEFTASSISLSEPAENSISISIAGQDVNVSEDNGSSVPAPADGYDAMLADYVSYLFTIQLWSNFVSPEEGTQPEEKPTELLDAEGNKIGTISYDASGEPTYILNNGGQACIDNESGMMISWTGSIESSDMEYNSASIEFSDFRITGITVKSETEPETSVLPEDVVFSTLDGGVSGVSQDETDFSGTMDITFNGRSYDQNEIMTMTVIFMLPTILSNADVVYEEGTDIALGKVIDTDIPVDIQGTYSNENGVVSIKGECSLWDMENYFSLSMNAEVQGTGYNRSILGYTFGPDSEELTVSYLNLIMGVLN